MPRCSLALLMLVPLVPPATAADKTPSPLPGVTGELRRHDHFPSQLVSARNVRVWLPPGYDTDHTERYPVLYAHDGQNLFDPKTSFLGIDWRVDEALTKLIQE